MSRLCHILHCASVTFLCCISLFTNNGAYAAGLNGVFDAGWTTAYQSQDSLTRMHQRLQSLGMEYIVLQYAAVEATHLYYPSQLDFLQNTQYKNNQLFPKSIEAAKIAGTKIWLGLYYDGDGWFTPPTITQLDTLSARNVRVLNELYDFYGREKVIEGVYIPQEIARYYWDGLREDATTESLVLHFLKPLVDAANAVGWKVIAAPFYNQNLETPEKLQSFFESLFAVGFKPDVIAVQDGIGANDAGKIHADIATVGKYERVVAQACAKYGIEFWVDAELFRTDYSKALADGARISAQLDTARASGAVNVIGYDLAVLGNVGLDSLEQWALQSTVGLKMMRNPNKNPRKQPKFYKLNGARVYLDRR